MNIQQSLAIDLRALFSGQPWFGDSMHDILDGLSWQQANAQPLTDGRSIHRLVLHVIAWHEFTLDALAGKPFPEIEWGGPIDFPPVPDDEIGWQNTLARLAETQIQLLDFYENRLDGRLLRRRVAGRKYDFRFLLSGLIQHDVYHFGQIGFLKRAVE